MTPHYCPLTQLAGGSAQPDPNTDGTARSDHAAAPAPAQLANSAPAGGSTTGEGATPPPPLKPG
jgi:hypothetical protein